jgi:hypothetical protein
MSRTELIIQLVKVVIGLAFGAYFLWWSLEVLKQTATAVARGRTVAYRCEKCGSEVLRSVPRAR